ncbi:M48 family metalloprotease [filamentous cyanobacterium LEGE 11480]|uniref:M48 family metalloprotease n=1 Tax=Romeriopsis navalis LEGE 11480 TaxID=2777977 RepID=A0A928Z252_9CYAN|nr:M48 family metallopeptidase [Romeriopsis navalis]MBE9029179.1 M48 family metalloprotease [Romeriopsis navalis LEGE 11480]
MRRLSPRVFRYSVVTLMAVMVVTFGQPLAAQAFNWRDLLPRVLPGLIQTIQLANISESQEMALGKQINSQLTRRQFKISRDQKLTSYVNQIGQRIVRNNTRPGIKYTFQVVDDDSINAAATMGGYVYINKGIVKAADNEAELASVIAHEISHVKERHSIEQSKNTALARTGLSALKLDRNTLVNLGMQFGFSMPRSRRFEFGADETGLRILNKAGYNPQAMVSFMKKLDSGRRSMPKWLSTHPAPSERVQRLQTMVNQISRPATGGMDVVAYARRVGKPVPTVQPVVRPVVEPKPAAAQPQVQPVSAGVVIPPSSVVIPSEPVRRSANPSNPTPFVISGQLADRDVYVVPTREE